MKILYGETKTIIADCLVEKIKNSNTENEKTNILKLLG